MEDQSRGKVEEILSELGHKIDILINEATSSSKEVRSELEKTIQLLKTQKEKLEEEFNTYAGQEKWQTTKSHFGNAIGELKKAVEALLNKNEKN
ncbi:MAG: hypothetical protein CMB82_05035 [Flammeovirgaceae bacterium]|nr:hypothetical protein [Flammeovirgaceae bacterium]|tara:strand:- start:2835 stop:3116 length:282 start_codon:yes stop_codon:yes gene_type:complete